MDKFLYVSENAQLANAWIFQRYLDYKELATASNSSQAIRILIGSDPPTGVIFDYGMNYAVGFDVMQYMERCRIRIPPCAFYGDIEPLKQEFSARRFDWQEALIFTKRQHSPKEVIAALKKRSAQAVKPEPTVKPYGDDNNCG